MEPDASTPSTKSFSGIFPAVPSFFKDQTLDLHSTRIHFEFLNTQPIQGVVVAGTTGELHTLSHAEKTELFKTARAVLKDKLCIAGLSSATVSGAIKDAHNAEKAGMDGLLALPPLGVRYDLQAFKHFFKTLNDNVACAVLIYNNCARFGYDLPIDLIQDLARNRRIVGIKDASFMLSRPANLKHLKTGWACLGGDDATFAAFLAMGGNGLISVGANIAPSLYQNLLQAANSNDFKAFKSTQSKLHTLHSALDLDVNPKVIKYMLSLKGIGDGTLRTPLSSLSDKAKTDIKNAIQNLGLC